MILSLLRRDKKPKPVTGLKSSDFEVYNENGRKELHEFKEIKPGIYRPTALFTDEHYN